MSRLFIVGYFLVADKSFGPLVRVNVLIGVGLLADPLAFADAGWILGTLILLFCALVTNCTLLLLCSPRELDQSLPQEKG